LSEERSDARGFRWPHVALTVAAARMVNRPVSCIAAAAGFTERSAGERDDTTVALGATKDGKLSALIHTGVTVTSTTNMFTEQFTFPARHLYARPI